MKLVPRRTGSGIKLPRMLTRLSDSEDRLACAGQCHVDQSVGLLVRIQSASESSMPVIAQSNAGTPPFHPFGLVHCRAGHQPVVFAEAALQLLQSAQTSPFPAASRVRGLAPAPNALTDSRR